MIEVDVNRRVDYSRTPGSEIQVTLGPFVFYVNTADGFMLAFGIHVGPVDLSWHIGSPEPDPSTAWNATPKET